MVAVVVVVQSGQQPRLFALPPVTAATPASPARDGANGGMADGEMPSAEDAYYASIERFPVLHPMTEKMLANRMHAGDPDARHRLYVCNLRWVHAYTKRLCRWYGVPQGRHLEIVGAANETIWRQMRAYDPKRGRFTTWATGVLHRDVPRAIEETTALIRRPAWVLAAERRERRDWLAEDAEAAGAAGAAGAAADGGDTAQPIPACSPFSPFPPSRIRRVSVVSLDAPAYPDDPTGETIADAYDDVVGRERAASDARRAAVSRQVAQAIAQTRVLSDRQRTVLSLHYAEGLEFVQIAPLLHISRERVRQLHDRALTNLRLGMRKDEQLRALAALV